MAAAQSDQGHALKSQTPPCTGQAERGERRVSFRSNRRRMNKKPHQPEGAPEGEALEGLMCQVKW